MPDMSKWLSNATPIDAAGRAVDAWNRIQADPVSLVLVRQGNSLSAQTVRIESDSGTSGLATTSSAGHTNKVRHTIFGVQDHPDNSVTNTDIKKGDRFAYNGEQYEVKTVISPPGEKQAFAESVV